MLLRKFLDSHRKYFTPGQPWTAMTSQIIDLLSAVHSQSLEALQEGFTRRFDACRPSTNTGSRSLGQDSAFVTDSTMIQRWNTNLLSAVNSLVSKQRNSIQNIEPENKLEGKTMKD
ncbi:hypothetical protein F511_44048 [Dorcoceras hygrometricum]|uniref:Uncharacterized protein n=1 Tax=Dorcoceras hygrometricum TaxID=472368 RepID=A0A2Z7CI58_9LAMI|nr:hypothetical protein F511_44048 [Dorcoceras hygrometricum]